MATDKTVDTAETGKDENVSTVSNAKVETPGKAHLTNQPTRLLAKEDPIVATNPTPALLKYVLAALLALSVLGVSVYGVLHQSSLKPPADPNDCSDPVTENRLRDTLKTTPNDYQTLVQLGSYEYNCTKDYPSAISAYSQAATVADSEPDKVSLDDRLQVRMSLGLSYLSNRNLNEAASQFQTILSKQPDNPNALFGLGAAIYATNPQQALGYWKKLIQQSPDSDAAKKAQQFMDALNSASAATPTPSRS